MAFPVIPVVAGAAVLILGGLFLMEKRASAAGKPGGPALKPADVDDHGKGVAEGSAHGKLDGEAGKAPNPRPMLNYSDRPDAQADYEKGYTVGYDGAYATGLIKAPKPYSTDSVPATAPPTEAETESKNPSTYADEQQGRSDGQAFAFAMAQMAHISKKDQETAKQDALRSSGWKFGARNVGYNQGWKQGFDVGWANGWASIPEESKRIEPASSDDGGDDDHWYTLGYTSTGAHVQVESNKEYSAGYHLAVSDCKTKSKRDYRSYDGDFRKGYIQGITNCIAGMKTSTGSCVAPWYRNPNKA